MRCSPLGLGGVGYSLFRLPGCRLLLLSLLTLVIAARKSRPLQHAGKDCAPGCEERGNCNRELGRCECPWGWSGPRCEVNAMGPCRQTPDDPGSCGFLVPKSCECYRACYRLYCARYGLTGVAIGRCANYWGDNARDARCFVRTDLPLDQQTSYVTDDLLNRTTWYQRIPELYGKDEYLPDMQLKNLTYALAPFPHRPPPADGRPPAATALPLHRCPRNCTNGRGVCLGAQGQPQGACSCHVGFSGPDCSVTAATASCWFAPDCGGRGTCISGFCHCRPGHWGLGCARSTAYALPGGVPGAGGVGGPGSQAEDGGGVAAGRDGAAAEAEVDGSDKAETAWEGEHLDSAAEGGASGAAAGSGGGNAAAGGGGSSGLAIMAERGVDVGPRSRLKVYVYDLPWHVAFPWEMDEWRHRPDPNYAAEEYFLRYFLLDNVTRTESPWEAQLFYVPALAHLYSGNVYDATAHLEAVLEHVRDTWPFFNRSGGRDHFVFLTGDRGACHLDRRLQDSPVIKVVHFGMQRRGLPWLGVDNQDYACVQVRRDLVVPPLLTLRNATERQHAVRYYSQVLTSSDGVAEPPGWPPRVLLLGFVGSVHQGEYSGGARQAIKAVLQSLRSAPEDVVFQEGSIAEYHQLLQHCKFCLAPYGYGYGMRLIEAVAFGCIPVIVQDYVYQPFEDFLPYEEFAVRLPVSDIPRTIEILRSYTDQDRARMRAALARNFRAFLWDREHGGEAYEWTLRALQRKLFSYTHGEAYDS